MKIRTRFAPSPTGLLHIGGARTALFNWLYAKKHKGEYVLRVEDTDKERSKQEYTQDILNSLHWLGIESDVEPIYQSKRVSLYQEIIEKLLKEGKAYYCYCSKERLEKVRENQIKNKLKPRYDGKCRELNSPPNNANQPVVRLKNPQNGSVVVDDQIRGKVTVQNSELDDLILARSDGSATYHLTVVVDDIDMQISHVIRGDDHLNNTFRQHNIFFSLRKPSPVYAHIPLIHGLDGKRLSKRHGAVSVNQYRAEGFLSEGLLNYLVRLGWSHGDQELFSIDEMIEYYELAAVQQSPATFDQEKLMWINQQHMRNRSGEDMKDTLQQLYAELGIKTDDQPKIEILYDVFKERSKTLRELCLSTSFMYQNIQEYELKAAKKFFIKENLEILRTLKNNLNKIDNWLSENIHEKVKLTAEQLSLKMGKVAPPLRLAVTGGAESPSIDVTLWLLGKEKHFNELTKQLNTLHHKGRLLEELISNP